MKLYRTRASSGKNRGAQDVFRLQVYEDLEILERYVLSGKIQKGVLLVMTDYKSFVFPKSMAAKSWIYNTSQDHVVAAGQDFTHPIGGRKVSIKLINSYRFSWSEFDGKFWFSEIEGKKALSGDPTDASTNSQQ